MKNQAKEIVDISNHLYKRGLSSGTTGNVSSRLKTVDKDIIAITPTLKSLCCLKEEDVVLVDIDGNILTKGNPSSEFYLHLAIYKNREDVNGIVHTHSPFATGFAYSEKKIKTHPRLGKVSGRFIKELDYIPPGSAKLAESVYDALGEDNVIILKDHGIIAVGNDLENASELSEFVEEFAKTQFISQLLNFCDD